MADLLPILIEPEMDRHFTVKQGSSNAPGLAWDEMLGTVASFTHPDIPRGLNGMPKPARSAAEDPGTPIVISLDVNEAKRFSESMADLLCWVGGFKAVRPDDLDADPMGAEKLRDLRIKLRRALAEARGEPEGGLSF